MTMVQLRPWCNCKPSIRAALARSSRYDCLTESTFVPFFPFLEHSIRLYLSQRGMRRCRRLMSRRLHKHWHLYKHSTSSSQHGSCSIHLTPYDLCGLQAFPQTCFMPQGSSHSRRLFRPSVGPSSCRGMTWWGWQRQGLARP